MKLLLVSVIIFAPAGIGACGAENPVVYSHVRNSDSTVGRDRANSRAPEGDSDPVSRPDTDGDVDGFGRGTRDFDNDANDKFGLSASQADRRHILGLVRRYYAAAVAGRGARACAMLDLPTVESVLEEQSGSKRPAAARGHNCTEILSTLFKQRHRELAEDIAAGQAVAVEVRGNRGVVLMRFGTVRERMVLVRREGATWKMAVTLDAGSL